MTNLADAQHLRVLVVLQHSVGVEGGSVIHLLHIRTRLLTLTRDKKLIWKHTYLTVSVTEALWGPNHLIKTFGKVSDCQNICLHLRVESRQAHRYVKSCRKVPLWQQLTLTRTRSRVSFGFFFFWSPVWKSFDLELNDIHSYTHKMRFCSDGKQRLRES